VPKTLLAVDDSLTMRKVVEMTFAGEDLKVVTVASPQDALQFAQRNRPDIVLCDVSLDGINGYDLCKRLKDELRTVPVVLLTSKQNPFDPTRAKTAGADDHSDKPYDTGKAIELIRKVLQSGKSIPPSAISVTPPQGASVLRATSPAKESPITPTRPVTPITPATPPVREPSAQFKIPSAASMSGANRPMPATGAAASSFAKPPPRPVDAPRPEPARSPEHAPRADLRSPTADFLQRASTDAPRDKPALDARTATPIVNFPAPTPAAKEPEATLRPAVAASASNGVAIPATLQGKLAALGLSQIQMEGVLAISKEVIEQVVWEVVPELAETMIREEIERLTKE
jgi:CheY-like chemotaxis protein